MTDLNASGDSMDPKDILKLTPEMEKNICELIRSNRNAEAAEMYCISMLKCKCNLH